MVCLDIHHILVKFQSVAVCICVGIAFSRFFDMKNLIKNGGSKLEIKKKHMAIISDRMESFNENL